MVGATLGCLERASAVQCADIDIRSDLQTMSSWRSRLADCICAVYVCQRASCFNRARGERVAPVRRLSFARLLVALTFAFATNNTPHTHIG